MTINEIDTICSELIKDIKSYRFCQDSYFRDSLYYISEASGSNKIIEVMSRYSFLILKPDAISARKAEVIINDIRSRGFDIVFCEKIMFNKFSVREIWKYELNTATIDRIRLFDIFLSSGDSLFIFLYFNGINDEFNDASKILTKAKGNSISNIRKTDSIRYKANAKDGILTFIHTPDTTLDLIREIGIILDVKSIFKIFGKRDLISSFDLNQLINFLYRNTNEHKLDYIYSHEKLNRYFNGKIPETNMLLRHHINSDKNLHWDIIVFLNHNIHHNINESIPILEEEERLMLFNLITKNKHKV